MDHGGIERASLEARWIVEDVSGFSGTEFQLGLEALATTRGVARLDALVSRRLEGEPLQYVLGHWSFRSLDLLVDRRVLIPRSETEQVVETALAELERVAPAAGTVVDLGTGSGAVALSIATERPTAEVWAVESDLDAIQVARANLARQGEAGSRVRIELGSWFEPLPDTLRSRVDLIVSNPPYVSDDDALPADVERWEPAAALFGGGDDGTEAIRVILDQAPLWLSPQGVAVIEIGEMQGAAVAAMARAAGFVEVEIRRDYADRDRMLVARRASTG